MSNLSEVSYEEQAAAAFDKQSSVFDSTYAANGIIAFKRKRVRDHLTSLLPAGSKILELNAGTGDDAIYLAGLGHRVHATDVSPGMQRVLRQKVEAAGLRSDVSSEICSYTQLANLFDKGPYDIIFSNFAGLNCTDQLDKVFGPFASLLKPGGIVTLVILPSFCLWETLLLFKGKFRTAFRRFASSKGRLAHLEGQYFRCWYHNPSEVKRLMGPQFEMIRTEGLCTLVPPSYMENFDQKHPRVFRLLTRLEEKWKNRWPWRSVGDYYIISFRKMT